MLISSELSERGNSGDVLTECLDEIPEDGTDGLARLFFSFSNLESWKNKNKKLKRTFFYPDLYLSF